MQMKITQELELNKINGSTEAEPKALIKHVLLNKTVVVSGSVLEAQFTVGNNLILIVSEGNPLEEALYIYLLDRELVIKDALELSADYTAGIFSNFFIIDPCSIKFSFFEHDDTWILKVFDRPAFRVLKNTYPVKRPLSIFHRNWLTLSKS